MKTKKIYTNADNAAIKYFGLNKTKYNLIFKVQTEYQLGKNGIRVWYFDIVTFINGYYAGQKEVKNDKTKLL